MISEIIMRMIATSKTTTPTAVKQMAVDAIKEVVAVANATRTTMTTTSSSSVEVVVAAAEVCAAAVVTITTTMVPMVTTAIDSHRTTEVAAKEVLSGIISKTVRRRQPLVRRLARAEPT